MTDPLIIAGSAEGHALARAVPGAQAVLTAPLRTDPGDVGYQVVSHDAVLQRVADGQGPVVLASHPCDPSFRKDLPQLCQQSGRALLHLCRPPWEGVDGDDWHFAAQDSDVAEILPKTARVFVGLGRSVARLEPHLQGRYLVIRQLGARGAVYGGHGHYLDTDAPVTVPQEIEMLRAEKIDWLLVRNAGGAGAFPKLAAARALGLPVAMLSRPEGMPGVTVAQSVEEAVAWVNAQ